MSDLETAQFWSTINGEDKRIRTFARIPTGWEDKLDQHPQDSEIFYWLDEKEWLSLGAGEKYDDIELLSCACDECESERYAEHWVEELS